MNEYFLSNYIYLKCFNVEWNDCVSVFISRLSLYCCCTRMWRQVCHHRFVPRVNDIILQIVFALQVVISKKSRVVVGHRTDISWSRILATNVHRNSLDRSFIFMHPSRTAFQYGPLKEKINFQFINFSNDFNSNLG